jgi:hypothetical protein
MRRHHVGGTVVVDRADGKQVSVGLATVGDIVVEIIGVGGDPRVMRLGDFTGDRIITYPGK